MQKLVWKDKEGTHVMVGSSGRLEKKRKELEMEKTGKIRQNDTPCVVMSILSILVYIIYMMIV